MTECWCHDGISHVKCATIQQCFHPICASAVHCACTHTSVSELLVGLHSWVNQKAVYNTVY